MSSLGGSIEDDIAAPIVTDDGLITIVADEKTVTAGRDTRVFRQIKSNARVNSVEIEFKEDGRIIGPAFDEHGTKCDSFTYNSRDGIIYFLASPSQEKVAEALKQGHKRLSKSILWTGRTSTGSLFSDVPQWSQFKSGTITLTHLCDVPMAFAPGEDDPDHQAYIDTINMPGIIQYDDVNHHIWYCDPRGHEIWTFERTFMNRVSTGWTKVFTTTPDFFILDFHLCLPLVHPREYGGVMWKLAKVIAVGTREKSRSIGFVGAVSERNPSLLIAVNDRDILKPVAKIDISVPEPPRNLVRPREEYQEHVFSMRDCIIHSYGRIDFFGFAVAISYPENVLYIIDMDDMKMLCKLPIKDAQFTCIGQLQRSFFWGNPWTIGTAVIDHKGVRGETKFTTINYADKFRIGAQTEFVREPAGGDHIQIGDWGTDIAWVRGNKMYTCTNISQEDFPGRFPSEPNPEPEEPEVEELEEPDEL